MSMTKCKEVKGRLSEIRYQQSSMQVLVLHRYYDTIHHLSIVVFDNVQFTYKCQPLNTTTMDNSCHQQILCS